MKNIVILSLVITILIIANYLSFVEQCGNVTEIADKNATDKKILSKQGNLFKQKNDPESGNKSVLNIDESALRNENRANTAIISGEVISPGTITIQGKITLVESIVKAGGCTQRANLEAIKIIRIRGKKEIMLSVNLYDRVKSSGPERIFYLESGDLVYVPEKSDKALGVNKAIHSNISKRVRSIN